VLWAVFGAVLRGGYTSAGLDGWDAVFCFLASLAAQKRLNKDVALVDCPRSSLREWWFDTLYDFGFDSSVSASRDVVVVCRLEVYTFCSPSAYAERACVV
jgi:hypothetical protein